MAKNWYRITDEKIAALEVKPGGEANVIEIVKRNGKVLPVDSTKAVDVEVQELEALTNSELEELLR